MSTACWPRSLLKVFLEETAVVVTVAAKEAKEMNRAKGWKEKSVADLHDNIWISTTRQATFILGTHILEGILLKWEENNNYGFSKVATEDNKKRKPDLS